MNITSRLRPCQTPTRRSRLAGVLLFAVAMLWSAPAHAQISLGTYSIGDVYAQISGSFATITVDPATPLPVGLALRTDTPPFFPPTVHAGIIGLATTPGTFTFNLLRDGIPASYQIKITSLVVKDTGRCPTRSSTRSIRTSSRR